MKNVFSLLVILCLFVKVAYAKSNFVHDSTRSYSINNDWEVGVDLLPLINKSNESFGYIVRRNYQIKNRHRAIRFKFLPEFSYSPSNSRNVYGKSRQINFAFGYEFQKKYSKFSIYYGPEISFSNENSETRSFSQFVITNQNIFGLNGLIGAKYRLTKHLSISSETHLSYSYQTTKGKTSGTVLLATPKVHRLDFFPIYILYFSYHFR